MLISPRSPNSPIPTGCGGAAMRTAVSAGGGPVSHSREQAGGAGAAEGLPPRDLSGPGRVPGRPLPRSGDWARAPARVAASTAGPARGPRPRAPLTRSRRDHSGDMAWRLVVPAGEAGVMACAVGAGRRPVVGARPAGAPPPARLGPGR